jgi:hypothetical protein
VNHHLAKVVTLLSLLHRLRHGMTVRTAVLRVRLILSPVIAIGAVTRAANTVVALLLDLLHLAVLEVRSRAEHPGDADEGEQEQDDLDKGLAGVELLFGGDLYDKEIPTKKSSQSGWTLVSR